VPGVITHGGDVANVIPDRAVARFSLRAADKAYVDFIRERVEECARGAAIATRCDVATRLYEPQYVELISNPVLVRLFREQLALVGLEEFGVDARGMGSLDIGNLSHVVPAIHPDLAIAEPDVGSHTPAFCAAAVSKKADAMIPVAAETLAGVGLRLLEEPRLVKEARAHLPPRESSR
jgi:metal-dependent amidase/aminoacylase/carboxypeptidase family protein